MASDRARLLPGGSLQHHQAVIVKPVLLLSVLRPTQNSFQGKRGLGMKKSEGQEESRRV